MEAIVNTCSKCNGTGFLPSELSVFDFYMQPPVMMTKPERCPNWCEPLVIYDEKIIKTNEMNTNKNLAYPLAIEGTKEELKKLVPELVKLGYGAPEFTFSEDQFQQYPYLATCTYLGKGNIDFGNDEAVERLGLTKVSLPELGQDCILTLAAMRSDGDLCEGEMMYNNESFEYYVLSEPVIKYEEERRATFDEIITHFKQKNEQKPVEQPKPNMPVLERLKIVLDTFPKPTNSHEKLEQITPIFHEETHQEALARLNLKVGDMVKVLAKAEDRSRGWDAIWGKFMDRFIGKIVKVVGFVVINGKDYGVTLEDEYGQANFPAFVLEKVEPQQEPKPEYDQQALLDRIKELEQRASIVENDYVKLYGENKSLKEQVTDLKASYDKQVEEINKYRKAVEDMKEELSQARFESSQRLVEIVQLKETIASLNLLIRKANINDDHTS